MVSERTVRRWISSNRPSKQAVDKLINIDRSLNEHWNSFKINQNSITTPSGYSYSTQDLESLSIDIARLKAFYNKNKRF